MPEHAEGRMKHSTHLLSTLLLSQHLLLLRNDLRLVLKAQREREADEDGGGGDDPHEVADELSAAPNKRGSGRELGEDALARGGRDDVNECGKAVEKCLVISHVRACGRQGDGGRGAGGRRRGVGRGVCGLGLLLVDNGDLDHDFEWRRRLVGVGVVDVGGGGKVGGNKLHSRHNESRGIIEIGLGRGEKTV